MQANARIAAEQRTDRETEESFGDHAERYVHAYGKDIGSTRRAFFANHERAVA